MQTPYWEATQFISFDWFFFLLHLLIGFNRLPWHDDMEDKVSPFVCKFLWYIISTIPLSISLSYIIHEIMRKVLKCPSIWSVVLENENSLLCGWTFIVGRKINFGEMFVYLANSFDFLGFKKQSIGSKYLLSLQSNCCHQIVSASGKECP